MTQIHFPTLAHPDFAGKTGAGDIADAMAEVDYNVGPGARRDRQARHRAQHDRDLVHRQRRRAAAARGADRPGPWSGFYNTVMEGGVRTPCIIRWPGRIPAGPRVERDRPPDRSASRRSPPPPARDIVPKDRAIDGVNQLPFLEGKQAKSNREQRHLLHEHAAPRREVARLEVPLRVPARSRRGQRCRR